MANSASADSAVRKSVVIRLAVLVARVALHLPPHQLARFMSWVGNGHPSTVVRQVEVVRESVCAASRRCAGLGCLQRSVAVVLACRWLHGVAPDWCVGFALEPFTAHAWVEVGGTPVGEPMNVSAYEVVHSARFAR